MNNGFDLPRLFTDPNVTRLALWLQSNQSKQGKYLAVTDENWSQCNWASLGAGQNASLKVVSNRYDIAQQALNAGLVAEFNDFDFSSIEPHSYDVVLYRVSKERACSHHVINQASKLLKLGGTLVLSGEKNDGVKTYVKQACILFGDRTAAEKKGKGYLATITLHEFNRTLLDDKNYPSTRESKKLPSFSQITKPGIFGWDKIDRGSAFLSEHIPIFLTQFSEPPQTLLDLGCGYGYLACQASKHGIHHVTATDNNAAALLAAAENLKAVTADYNVIAADAGNNIVERFDAVWCNPPFHQGFSVDGDMSDKFLRATKRLLSSSGRALFVVNTFIPLERSAKKHFRSVEVLANNGSFKLIALALDKHKNTMSDQRVKHDK